MHPVFAFLKREDYYSQPDSSLRTKSPLQGYIATGFFIPADRIFSSGMHRLEIFHPYRQNLLLRDASPWDFSSLQTKSPHQGCIATGFFILADRISSPGMHHLRNYTPDFRAPHHLIKPTVPIFKLPTFVPDDLFYFLYLRGNKTLFLCFSFQFQHVLIKVGHKQSVLYHAVLFEFSFCMKPGNFSRHPACIL